MKDVGLNAVEQVKSFINFIQLEILLESTYSIDAIGPYLSLCDFGNLMCVSKSCKKSLTKWIPDDILPFVVDLKKSNITRLLVFGVHDIAKSSNIGLYRNPAPILQYSFNAVGVCPSDKKLVGKPFSELVTATPPPVSLGRSRPNVCIANELGQKIFYCGGETFIRNNDDQWIHNMPTEKSVSRLTAFFNVNAATWQQLPPMPDKRSGAGCCRVGTKIYIIGGEESNKSVICFDTESLQWIDSGIPNYPGRAYSKYAVVAKDETTIVVASGAINIIEQVFDEFFDFGGRPSHEVFSLDLVSKTWTRLPDLPESFAASTECNGFLIKRSLDGGFEENYVAIQNNKKLAYLTTDPQPCWQELSDVPIGIGMRGGTFTSIDNGSMVVLFSLPKRFIYNTTSNVWKELPQETLVCSMIIEDSNGEVCVFDLSGNDTIVPMS